MKDPKTVPLCIYNKTLSVENIARNLRFFFGELKSGFNMIATITTTVEIPQKECNFVYIIYNIVLYYELTT